MRCIQRFDSHFLDPVAKIVIHLFAKRQFFTFEKLGQFRVDKVDGDCETAFVLEVVTISKVIDCEPIEFLKMADLLTTCTLGPRTPLDSWAQCRSMFCGSGLDR